jgi:hypothetical protein
MADLSQTLYEHLARIEHKAHTIDRRHYFDRDEMAAYQQLSRLDFCKEDETGAGGRFAIFTITSQGHDALAAYRSS